MSPAIIFAAALTILIPISSSSREIGSTEEAQSTAIADWPMVGGSLDNARHSSLMQINTQNVKQLGAIWISERFDDTGTSTATPTVLNGVMYVTAGRRVYALDARTGRKIWDHKTFADAATPDHPIKEVSAAPNARGVALGKGMVFVGLMNGYVIALEQQSGRLVWSVQVGDDEPSAMQISSAAPIFVDGIVLTGLSGGDLNLRGRITAIDAVTGKELWHLFSIPGPGEPGHETWPAFNDTWRFGGGGVWTNAAVDTELGIAYFTTGNPVPAFAGDWRPGDNLYTCSLLAVDLRTGKLKWHYQLVHHDVFEADAGTPVILFDAHINGKKQNAIAVIRSDGYLFQLNRETGKPILPIKERPVPQLKSQRTSPTQPFPVNGESILMNCEEWRKERIPAGFRLGCMWTPPASPPPSDDPQNVLAPWPSVRVSPMAYSPRTKFFYAQGSSILSWPRRSQDPYLLSFDLTPLHLDSYGHLAAIDSRTGKIAWKTPIHTKANQFNYLRGGLLTTAGELVFRGSGDGNVQSYDARTGELLWTYQTGILDNSGSPMSYELDGRQYVAIPMGPAVWAFNLEGKLPPANVSIVAKEDDEFTGPTIESTTIEAISVKQQLYSAGTRSFVDEFTFNPNRARVRAGTKVMFVNNGNLRHEMASKDGTWSTGPLSPSQRAWITFDTPGKYTYICREHPWTYGQIIVVSSATTETQKTHLSSNGHSNGKKEFSRHCSSCHGEDLGGRSMAPSLTGSTFESHWTGMTVAELFDRVQMTMPPSSPGSLDRGTYLDIVAYLLHANEISVAAELKDDPSQLKGIVIRKVGELP